MDERCTLCSLESRVDLVQRNARLLREEEAAQKQRQAGWTVSEAGREVLGPQMKDLGIQSDRADHLDHFCCHMGNKCHAEPMVQTVGAGFCQASKQPRHRIFWVSLKLMVDLQTAHWMRRASVHLGRQE